MDAHAKLNVLDVPETKPNILELPNEILANIFQRLPVLDLLSVHQSCERFQPVTEYSFSKIYKEALLCLLRNNCTFTPADPDRLSYLQKCNFDEIEKILEFFGHRIKSLLIWNGAYKGQFEVTPVLKLLNTYAAENLKYLGFTNKLHVDIDRLDDFRKLFGQLEKLVVKNCFNNVQRKELLKRCPNLKELSIETSNTIDKSVLLNITTKIEKIFYKYAIKKGTVSSEDSCEFVRTHPNLKSLEIRGMYSIESNELKYFEKLESLLIDTRYAKGRVKIDWTDLFQLRSLKQFKVFSGHKDFDNLLYLKSKPKTNIKVFALNIDDFKDACHVLNALTFSNLKKVLLSARSYIRRTDYLGLKAAEMQVKSLATNLIDVEELYFMGLDHEFMPLICFFVKYFKNLKIVVLDTEKPKIEYLTQIADAQRNKIDKLVVKHTGKLGKKMKQMITAEREKFSVLDVIRCKSVDYNYFNEMQ